MNTESATSEQRELTLNAELVTIILTDSQRDQLAPIVRSAVRDRKGVIFCTAAPFILDGKTAFRLQAMFVDHKTASKALRSTLQRGLKRERTKPDGKKLVRVKVIGGSGTADREGRCAMAVVLAKGRRIELSRDFDAAQLRRVVEALEGF